MRIIPAIDLIGGETVRLLQGEYDRMLNYEISPQNAALKWESMGAELIHIVDLDGAKKGNPENLSVVREIVKALKIPVELGGGFRTGENISEALNAGVWRVIIGSRAFEDMDFARRVAKEFGARVIFSMDIKALKPSVRGWKKTLNLEISDILSFFASLGVKEIIYTDIERDGMLSGPNIDNLKRILSETDIKIISAGGVKTIEDILALKEMEDIGISGVIIGRALYEGTIDLKEAISVSKKNNTVS